MNYRRRARELDRYLQVALRGDHFSAPATEEATIAAQVTISGVWDDDLDSQQRVAELSAGMAILDIQKAVLEGGGDPNTGFTLGHVRHIAEGDRDPHPDEFVNTATFTLGIFWTGKKLKIDNVKKYATFDSLASAEGRAARIRRYLDDIDRSS
jgi:hypothetical protein